MSKPKGALTRCNGTMTESQYLAWIRSALRSKSLRWAPRALALELARRPYIGPIKAQRWEYKCAICSQWFKAKDVVVDHFPIAAGSIRSVEDIGEFCNNLYCETDNLRVLCGFDHDVHTLAEKENITFAEALLRKKCIEILKQPVALVLAYCERFNYNREQLSNASKRKKAVEEIINKENKDV